MSDEPINEVTRVGDVQMAVDECVICGREHRHGRSEAVLDGERTHKSAHCKPRLVGDDAPTGYYVELADDVEVVEGRLAERERTRIEREEGYVWLDNLEKDSISPLSTRRLAYVLETLDDADRLNEGLNWSSEVWDGCTVEELLGGLIEAENLLMDVRREAAERQFRDADGVEVTDE